ncbi:glycine C-acetyltransferase [Nocardioides cynanchi]|uniref:glycine C-acetyltransferase n=1 Tax=Nocardioides cynanchi TaxID=2558918 RepID=UPI0012468366|nr:glycine C-acetyltransferase [Nocardioides cynanchi]
MPRALLADLAQRTAGLRDDGLFKSERVIASPQTAHITLADGSEVLNLCANNYLGLADHPELVRAAHEALDAHGYGMASVRFICGTQTVHTELEAAISTFLGTDDTILYSSCFDANGGLFETILDEQDCVISDALNHASIIDGIRLCKARRLRYDNNDMAQLEQHLRDASDARYRLIATDGVFSMDGVIADLHTICDLAEKYDALVMVDDSHAVGFVGDGGRGTPEYCEVLGRVDIITGTLGKALGGASGGYTSGRREIVDWLRQRSRPYLFSNSLAPTIAATTLHVLEMLTPDNDLQRQLRRNATRFRTGMESAGFTLAGAGHPIIPVMLGDAKVAGEMAQRLLAEGVYVIAFSFPVVPQGKARIRTQMSAAHSDDDIDRAVAAFAKVGTEMGVLT